MNNKLNLLVSVNDNYVKPLEVMLFSLKQHTNLKLNVFSICITLSDKSKKELKLFALKNDFAILFLEIGNIDYSQLKLNYHFSLEIYSRLMLLSLVPDYIDRILYLDADIIINKSIDTFYSIDFMGNLIAACPSRNKLASDERKTALAIPIDKPYFNSGVILFNLSEMRTSIEPNFFIKYLYSHQNLIEYGDQDVLNATLWERTLFLNTDLYNYMTAPSIYLNRREIRFVIKKTVVIHYFGSDKPWNKYYYGKLGLLWEKIACKSKVFSKKMILRNKIIRTNHFCQEMIKKIVKLLTNF